VLTHLGYTREIGMGAEEQVTGYLRALGYRILGRNYLVHSIGEIDIVAEYGDTLLFVEVKARRSDRLFAGVEGLITGRKLQRIRNTASLFVQSHGRDNSICKIVEAFVHISPSRRFPKIVLLFLE
jgi:putative endonuclease